MDGDCARLRKWLSTALHFAYYDFCRVHQTLRVTPAMEARLTYHVWSIEDLMNSWTDVTR